MTTERKEKYRDKLVRMIEASGRELIARADNLIPKDLDSIVDLYIRLDFPQSCEAELPTMDICINTINKEATRVVIGKEVKTDGSEEN